MAPVKPPTLYIDRKPYFLEAPPIATNFLLLGSRQGGGGAPPHYLQVYEIRRAKGPQPPRAGRHRGVPAPLHATSPPSRPPPLPLGEAHLHHHLLQHLIIPTVISWQK
jgi:hypothetical protein